MVKRMLIDAAHPEEMRVVVVDGTRLEEFDVETSTKRQLKGNIYLAKVIRVEPSLQAAFVDYGNERHGFLPFSEIHPDYYQIPVADREALKETLMQSQKESARQEEEEVEKEISLEESEAEEDEAEDDFVAEEAEHKKKRRRRNGEFKEAAEIEVVREGDDTHPYRSYFDMLRKYKIQEVIRRNQILLVQVVKEERGNKGAALTTYLSLAGRYCVLMPNNARGGGVSRKISNMADRHKLKAIVNALPVPDGMSVILRTAGRERTKVEIKRDYEYLIKTWIQIRDMTMASVAPCLIHEEGNLIRRSIRDIYTPDIAEILIEGDSEFKAAKDFVKMIIPSHAKKVICYKGDIPLFHKYQVETQLEMLHNPIVQLKSGGYLVINPTEALVAIDVNSGRSTREHSIEDTALKTNLEAVEEVARQLRLRDLAGLIVIDLIDMEEPRNNIAVERKMRDILRKDKARIQLARINGFGLMEISRQRLHSSFIETSYHTCPYCQGTGVQRSIESVSVHLLRLLEEEASTQSLSSIVITVPSNVALYILNHKRNLLADIEKDYDLSIVVNGDDDFISPTDYRLEKTRKIIASDESDEENQNEDMKSQKKKRNGKKKEETEPENDETSAEEGEEQERKRHSSRRNLFGKRRQRYSSRRGDESNQEYLEEMEGFVDNADASSSMPIADEVVDASRVEVDEVAYSQADNKSSGIDDVSSVDNDNPAIRKVRNRRYRRKGEGNDVSDDIVTVQSEKADDFPDTGKVSDKAEENAEVNKPKKRGRPRKKLQETEDDNKQGQLEGVEPKAEKSDDVPVGRGMSLEVRKTTSVVARAKGAVILFSSHNDVHNNYFENGKREDKSSDAGDRVFEHQDKNDNTLDEKAEALSEHSSVKAKRRGRKPRQKETNEELRDNTVADKSEEVKELSVDNQSDEKTKNRKGGWWSRAK